MFFALQDTAEMINEGLRLTAELQLAEISFKSTSLLVKPTSYEQQLLFDFASRASLLGRKRLPNDF